MVKLILDTEDSKKKLLAERRLGLGFRKYPVEECRKPVIQCFQCQKFGHRANECNGKQTCPKCSGNHKESECVAEESHCALCNLKHSARYRGCLVYQEAKRDNNSKLYSQVVAKQESRNNQAPRAPVKGNLKAK